MKLYISIGAIYFAIVMFNLLLNRAPSWVDARETASSVWWGWLVYVLIALIGTAVWPIALGYDIYNIYRYSKDNPT